MINGSLIAPFQHDSAWPDDVVRLFRHAVYRLHKPLPGSDSVALLREVANKKRDFEEWGVLRKACDKVVHVAIDGIDSEEQQVNLVTNLLSFANLLLIGEFGIIEMDTSVRWSDVTEKEREDAKRAFIDNVEASFESLQKAIDRTGSARPQRPDLADADVLAPIASVHVMRKSARNNSLEVILSEKNSSVCKYHFRPFDPVGWEMVSGIADVDRFADDRFSVSKWP